MGMLAYTPFLQPLNLHDAWWLTLPVVSFFLSMAYKAVRTPELGSDGAGGHGYWRAVLLLTAQIVVGLIALAAGLFVFVELIVPQFQR